MVDLANIFDDEIIGNQIFLLEDLLKMWMDSTDARLGWKPEPERKEEFHELERLYKRLSEVVNEFKRENEISA